jgi:uncharacterized membrane protein YkoI
MSIGQTLHAAMVGKTIKEVRVQELDYDSEGSIYYGFRIVFTDGTSIEIEEGSQTGEIRFNLSR